MKKFILGAVLSALVVVASPALAAFQSQVGNGRTMATQSDLVVKDINGLRVYPVSSNPQTADERAIYTAWLEAQVADLQRQLSNIQVPECESDEQVRASGIAEKISSLSALIASFLAR